MKKIVDISVLAEHPDLEAAGADLVVTHVSAIEGKFAFEGDELVKFYSTEQRKTFSVTSPCHGIVSELNVATHDEFTPKKKLMKIRRASVLLIIFALASRKFYEFVTELIWEVEERFGETISRFVQFFSYATLTSLAAAVIIAPFYFYFQYFHVFYVNDVPETDISELAGKINAQIARCWREPLGAPDPTRLAVVVSFGLSRDGRLAGKPRVIDGPPSSEPFADEAMRNAILAVEKCSPLKNLPVELYDEWRRVEVKFVPEMGR